MDWPLTMASGVCGLSEVWAEAETKGTSGRQATNRTILKRAEFIISVVSHGSARVRAHILRSETTSTYQKGVLLEWAVSSALRSTERKPARRMKQRNRSELQQPSPADLDR